MKLDSVILAVEDQLSEAVSTKILNSFDIRIKVVLQEGRNSYLRKKAPELNRAANAVNIFLLTDLDTPKDCPPNLIRSWVKVPLNPRFMFRVAILEVESWIMADRDGVAKFLSIPVNRIPGLFSFKNVHFMRLTVRLDFNGRFGFLTALFFLVCYVRLGNRTYRWMDTYCQYLPHHKD